MNFITKGLFILFSVLLLTYVLLPSPSFPNPPPGSRQSEEDGDNETLLRRAYFTDFTRQEVLDFYQKQFRGYRLNYPPEESQTLIRDQTRSTFLEEIVHPFRESIFVNGFEPKVAKDEIWYKGVHYRQKIIIKYIPSNIFVRLSISILTILTIWILVKEIVAVIKQKKH